jgi:CRP-like cAMP-binding protein
MPQLTSPQIDNGNALLGALPEAMRRELLPRLRRVRLSAGDIVYEFGQHLDHVCFPTNSIVALLYTNEDGTTTQVGLAGRDGVVGLALFLGGDATPNRAVVQVAGDALTLEKTILREEFARAGPLQRILLRYTQSFITEVSQSVACNRMHSVKQRLCRLLLSSRDRLQRDEMAMTHDLIADILGGRRESVALAAAELQNSGIIRYVRGKVKLVDCELLAATACECYRVVKEECDRLVRDLAKQEFDKEQRLHT